MGLQLDFNIRQSDNTKELRFTETTGLYNAVSNPGGYGVLNDLPAAATIVTLKITPPGGVEVPIDMLIPVSGFPTFDKNVEYIVKGQDLGIGTDSNLPDGVWNVTYEVTTPGEVSMVTDIQKIFISARARCCVNNMLCDVDLCDCDGTQLAQALEASAYLQVAKACGGCGDSVKFTDTLKIISNYCNKCC